MNKTEFMRMVGIIGVLAAVFLVVFSLGVVRGLHVELGQFLNNPPLLRFMAFMADAWIGVAALLIFGLLAGALYFGARTR